MSWIGLSAHESADIVGHSLGGALAQWIAAAFTSDGNDSDRIDQLVTFNSPGISEDAANSFVPSKATSVTHYIVNGDVVSMAGDAFIAGKANQAAQVRMASFSDWNLIDKHLLPLTVPNVGERYRRPDVSWKNFDSVEELNSFWYSHTDPDYRLWLLGLEIGLLSLLPESAPLLPVPAELMFRGTTEANRELIGTALRTVKFGIEGAEALFEWTVDAVGDFVLKLGSQAHDFYQFVQITVDPNFSLSVDDGDPPMLRFDGGVSLNLGNAIHIELPSWLGGPITADHLLELADMDMGGVIDRDHLEVNGKLALLGNLVTLDGKASLDWQRAEIAVGGALDILDGFITANAAARIGTSLNLVMQSGAAISVPDSVRWIGGMRIVGGNFLLNYINDPSPSNDFVAGWGWIDPLELGLRVWFDGRWEIMGGKELKPLEQKVAQAMTDRVASEAADSPRAATTPYHESYAIGPDTGWVLFIAEWENPSSAAVLTLQTPSGQVLTGADPSLVIVSALSNDRRKAIWIKKPAAGTWVATLSGITDLGVVDIAAMVSVPAPSVHVVHVTDGRLREPIDVQLAASATGSQVKVALFYDTDGAGSNGVLIADGLLPDDGGIIDYTWDTSGVAAGTYHLYARASDEVNPPVYAYADQPVNITDPWPTIDVESPGQPDNVRSLAFGNVLTFASPTQTLIVRNEGTGDLIVTQAGGLNSPFSIAPANGADGSDDWVIAAGLTKVITLSFSPMAGGQQSTTLTLRSNDPTELNYAIQLSGMAIAGWENPTQRCDVDGGGTVTALDVLLLINEINVNGARELASRTAEHPGPPLFLDPSGDARLGPMDVLTVINYINGHPSPQAEAEATDSVSPRSQVGAPQNMPSGSGSWVAPLDTSLAPFARALRSLASTAPFAPAPAERHELAVDAVHSAHGLQAGLRRPLAVRQARGGSSGATTTASLAAEWPLDAEGLEVLSLDSVLNELCAEVAPGGGVPSAANRS